MKKVIQHPKDSTEFSNGRRYWRSVEEYSDSPEFQKWLEREFPQGASEFEAGGLSRRNFLRLMGASMALAGFGLGGCSRPEAHIVPYTQSPEWLVPGKMMRYATAMPQRRGALPLLVTTFNGRPIKIEGNPNHPCSRGKTDPFAQASVLDLYDPDRLRTFLRKRQADENGARKENHFVSSTGDEFFKHLDSLRVEWAQTQGAGLAILADQTLSPTRERLRGELFSQFPKMTWAVYEPLMNGNDTKAAEIAFGTGTRVVPHLSQANVVLAVDCDFLGTDQFGLKAVRDYTDKRRIHQPSDTAQMNRLYTVESRYTITGAMADHRLRMPVSEMGLFLENLFHALIEKLVPFASSTPRSPLARIEEIAGIYRENFVSHKLQGAGADIEAGIQALATDLLSQRARSLVLVGPNQPVEVQLLGFAINQFLGNIGANLPLTIEKALQAPAETIQALAEKINRGEVQTLIILGGNPVYNAPSLKGLAQKSEPTWGSLLKSISRVIHLTYEQNETSQASHWVVPAAHYLESWGDALAHDGSYLSIQPMIEPLLGGISQIQLLARMAGQGYVKPIELIQKTAQNIMLARAQQGLATKEVPAWNAIWEELLHEGSHSLYFGVGRLAAPVQLSARAVNEYLTQHPILGPSAELFSRDDFLEIVFAPDYKMDDGRYNNNAWLQEMPDPITKLTWDNAVLMSPATARKLGVSSPSVDGVVRGDAIQIEVQGKILEAWVLVVPGHADHSITLPLGYGREIVGRVGEGSGFNAYPLKNMDKSYVMGVVASVPGLVGSAKHPLAVTQDHFSMEGRAIAQEAPIEHYKKDPKFTHKLGLEAHSPPLVSFYKNPPLDAPHQWAMTIDLNTCIGCNACVIACQSENNIPVVGKEQVIRGREMHWIRVDRYFTSPTDYNQDKNEMPADPQMMMQPIPCMQCENAPCETVCPVNATVHSEEGLNVMVYNRCIGTRYCANNCPYKVRRFNFFDYNQRPKDYAKLGEKIGPINAGKLYRGPLEPKGMDEISKFQKNPNVTVRMRGVMEKCTFCVQRLETAKIAQKIKAGASPDILVRDGEVQTACQQACPADAIVFGNKVDPNSRIAQMLTIDHRYELMAYLNTRPRVSYLARLRNPNPDMPGADQVGMYLLSRAHQHAGHAEAHGESPSHPSDALHPKEHESETPDASKNQPRSLRPVPHQAPHH